MSDKLICENQSCEVYENDITKMLTNYCTEEKMHDLFPLKNHQVFVVKQKEDNCKVYMLYEKGAPIYMANSIEAMAAHIDILRFRHTRDTLSSAEIKIKENKDD